MASLKKTNKTRPRSGGPGRWPYRVLGLLLWPLTWAAARTLARMIGGGANPLRELAASTAGWFFCGGVFLWLALYGILPRPVRLYVLGHELTHALVAWLSGGQARRLRVGATGGSVQVTVTNVAVVLGPYFVPFYAALVLAAYGLAALFIDPAPWYGWWMGALGISWGFHLTFTVSTLLRPQSDIGIYGPLFSFAIILLFNLQVLALGVVMVASPTIEEWVAVQGDEIKTVFGWLVQGLVQLVGQSDTIKPWFSRFTR